MSSKQLKCSATHIFRVRVPRRRRSGFRQRRASFISAVMPAACARVAAGMCMRPLHSACMRRLTLRRLVKWICYKLSYFMSGYD